MPLVEHLPFDTTIAGVWPVGAERRARRGRHPFYQAIKWAFIGLVVVVVAMMLAVVWGVSSRPWLTGPAYIALLGATLVLCGLAGLYVLRRLVVMLLDRRGRLQGGKLHRRLLAVFAVLAVLPAVAVGGVAIFLLNQGIESWFAVRVSSALEAGEQVAEGYVEESSRSLLAESTALGRDEIWTLPPLLLSEQAVAGWLRTQLTTRELDELALVDADGQVLASGAGVWGAGLPPAVSVYVQTATAFGVRARAEVFRDVNAERLMAAVPLPQQRWLVAERRLPEAMLARVAQMQQAAGAYQALRNERDTLRLQITMYFVLLMMGVVTAAVWTAGHVSARITRPLTGLVHGTNRVSSGDLSVRLVPSDDDELGVLTQAFNRMTLQLASNRDLVEKKNAELDNRRRFNEAVLLGVSAGVVAVDEGGVVKVANPSATALLHLQVGDKLARVVPELSEALRNFHAQLYEGEVGLRKLIQNVTVKVQVAEGDMRTLQVRLLPIGGELSRGGSGVVLTFDDITPLVGAQRLAAWQDVARRLAHEIKNPLTPIQLSAERMKRRYLAKMAEEDKPLFGQLAETIVQAAEEMRRMVNEFSDFARMPQAVREPMDVVPLVESVLMLQRARGGVEYTLRDEAGTVFINADKGQLQRVFTNVLENAYNAIAEREGTNLPHGRIQVVVRKTQGDTLTLEIHDNGRGLPADKDVDQLFDPYVTTRKNGTGLGLAIVKKVMDEHGGTVRMKRREEGGTVVVLSFPVVETPAGLVAVTGAAGGEETREPNKESLHEQHPHQTPDTGNSGRRRRGRRADSAGRHSGG